MRAAIESESWVHLTMKSSNKKTGPIPVSTTERGSCPVGCPFMDDGCFGDDYHLGMHWDKVSSGERGMSWEAFCEAVASFKPLQPWRHNQAGDLPHTDGDIDADKAMQLAEANAGRRGFTYSHHDVLTNQWNRLVIESMNERGFAVNLSGNSLEHADMLYDTGLPTVTVLPHDQLTNLHTPRGRLVVVCPEATHDNVTCGTCLLCQKTDRSVIVGFPAHGAKKASVVRVFKSATLATADPQLEEIEYA
jgi:hypothetical protein